MVDIAECIEGLYRRFVTLKQKFQERVMKTIAKGIFKLELNSNEGFNINLIFIFFEVLFFSVSTHFIGGL